MNAMILTVFLVATQMPPPPPTVPIGGVQVVVPAEPAQMVEFGVSLKEWLKFFSDRIVPTVQTGIDKYQKALKIVQFTVADMDCLTARMLQGHFANVLNSAISADYPVPMDIMDKYYQSYKNAEENARQKCGGPGNQGQRLWAVWVQEASGRGRYQDSAVTVTGAGCGQGRSGEGVVHDHVRSASRQLQGCRSCRQSSHDQGPGSGELQEEL
jgi:hypothetical protein